MSFLKFPKSVVDIAIADTSIPLHYRVYWHLSSRCDYETGVLHLGLSASSVASAVGCHRASVSRVIKKLRSLGWLVGGSGLIGRLVGFKSRPYRSASAHKRVAQVNAVVEEVVKEVAPHSPSNNGVVSRSEEDAWRATLDRVSGNIPGR